MIFYVTGYYSDPNCVHLPAGLGRTSANFDISSGSCGTVGDSPNGRYGPSAGGYGAFFENTIVVQYDHQVGYFLLLPKKAEVQGQPR